jgi:hypothetical protein
VVRKRLVIPIYVLTIFIIWTCTTVFRNAVVTERLDTWAVTLMFDLQAVGVAENKNIFPPDLTGSTMRSEELQAAFDPYSTTKLFSSTVSGVANPTIGPLSSLQKQHLLSAWKNVLWKRFYWQHRFRLFSGLLGAHYSPSLSGLSDSPQITQYKDNPIFQFKHVAAHQAYRSIIERLRHLCIFAPMWYFLLAAVLICFRWNDSNKQLRSWRLFLCLSALCYTAPYLIIAPSAELRYVLWSVLACWLSIVLSVVEIAAEFCKRQGKNVPLGEGTDSER